MGSQRRKNVKKQTPGHKTVPHAKKKKERNKREKSGECKFKCTENNCEKGFETLRGLKRHLKRHLTKVHNSKRQQKCRVCEESFTDKSDYKTHLASHVYACDQCSKVFSGYENLRKHKTIHETSNNFSCEICGKCFKARQNLTKHMLVHKEDGDVWCEKCGKKFKAKENLQKHLVTHNDTLSFPCSTCGKCFKAKQNLQVTYYF